MTRDKHRHWVFFSQLFGDIAIGSRLRVCLVQLYINITIYNKLQTLCDKLKEKDMTILMRDLNAKIGSDNSGYEEVMGTQGLGRMNENGEMLADFYQYDHRRQRFPASQDS